MAIQTINIGNVVNDGLGDDLRTAFQKVNANFSDLSASLTVTARNAGGTSGQGIFKEKVGNELSFKNLIAGEGITLEGFTDAVRITSTNPNSFKRIDTDAGVVLATTNPNITIQGSENISVTATGSVVTIDTDRNFETLFTSLDFVPIVGDFFNTLQFAISTANIDLGTISRPGDFYLDQGNI
jgi:hypothetical protein